MTSFGEYSAVGNRECLLDIITNIAPSANPMVDRFGKVSVDGVLVQWQTDSLRSPADNKQLHNATYASMIGTVTPTVLETNSTQILGAGYEIDETQEVVSKAGRTSEIALQKAKCLKEIAGDIEYSVLNHTAAVVAAVATEGEMKGIKGYISTEKVNNTGAALTETILENLMQGVWDNGGTEMSTIYTGARQKKVINNFGGTSRSMAQDAESYKKMVGVYENDFGTVQVVLDRHVGVGAGTADLFVLTDSMWQLGVLQPMVSVACPKVALTDSFIIKGQLTLISKQEKASGWLYNLL